MSQQEIAAWKEKCLVLLWDSGYFDVQGCPRVDGPVLNNAQHALLMDAMARAVAGESGGSKGSKPAKRNVRKTGSK